MDIINKLKVLILDDSPVAIAFTRNMLSKIGFKDELIIFSQSPKTGVALVKRERFDLVICDYNFNDTLDGRQVFEEIKHFKCLSPSSVFILITGDSSVYTVNSMLELQLDDYIVKPFNLAFLRERVFAAINRKKSLEELYTYKENGEFKKGLAVCDELLPFYPNYKNYINFEKGQFLKRLKLCEDSVKFHTHLAMEDSSEWVQLGLSNSLRELGNKDEAKNIVEKLLSKKTDSIDARKQLVILDAEEGNFKGSIENLELIKSLTKGSSERELALSNLCFSIEDYPESYKFYKNYFLMNKYTYRNDNWAKMNLIRRSLIAVDSSDSELNSEIEPMIKELNSLEDPCPNLNFSIECVLAHLLLVKHEFSAALEFMNKSYKRIKNIEHSHFYDLHYFCFLLLKCSFHSEFISLLPKLKEAYIRQMEVSLHNNAFEVVISSMNSMLKAMADAHNKKSKWLLEQHNKINLVEKKQKISILIDISNKFPTLISIRLEIINLIATTWPEGLGRHQVRKLIDSSDEVISALCPEAELQEKQYDLLIRKARNSLSDKRLIVQS